MIIKIFGRRGGRTIRDARPECGVWRVGELAVCVTDTWFDAEGRPAAGGPKVGDVMRVSQVSEMVVAGQLWTALCFETRSWRDAFAANGFRKPVIDESGADEEVAALIRRTRRVPAPESVDA